MKERLIAFISLLIVLLSLSGCHSKKNEDTKEKDIKEVIAEINNLPKYEFHQVSDTVDVEEAIDSLNIESDDVLPYDVYKVLRYIDMDGYERIPVVKVYLEYVVDENGSVIGEKYSFYDAFSHEYLFTCDDLENIECDNIQYVMSFGKLSDLKKIALSKGMDSSYVEGVFDDSVSKSSLSTSEVARIYVMLINSYNRLNNSDILRLNMDR